MDDQGILVGLDKKLEWLLEWWWKHYSAHNRYPVAFADFGMTEKGLAFCRERGQVITLPPRDLASPSEISLENRLRWEIWCGKGLWTFREAWFQKPFAFFHTPFSHTVWLDIDCQVRESLSPLFESLQEDRELALFREPEYKQKAHQELGLLLPGEIHYSSGVVAFRKGSSIIQYWRDLAEQESHNFIGDQDVLSRAIFFLQPKLCEFPPSYNWSLDWGSNSSALIIHYHTSWKLTLLKELVKMNVYDN